MGDKNERLPGDPDTNAASRDELEALAKHWAEVRLDNALRLLSLGVDDMD